MDHHRSGTAANLILTVPTYSRCCGGAWDSDFVMPSTCVFFFLSEYYLWCKGQAGFVFYFLFHDGQSSKFYGYFGSVGESPGGSLIAIFVTLDNFLLFCFVSVLTLGRIRGF